MITRHCDARDLSLLCWLVVCCIVLYGCSYGNFCGFRSVALFCGTSGYRVLSSGRFCSWYIGCVSLLCPVAPCYIVWCCVLPWCCMALLVCRVVRTIRCVCCGVVLRHVVLGCVLMRGVGLCRVASCCVMSHHAVLCVAGWRLVAWCSILRFCVVLFGCSFRCSVSLWRVCCFESCHVVAWCCVVGIFVFEALRSPAQNTQSLSICEVPRGTAAIFTISKMRANMGCNALSFRHHSPQKGLL